MNFIKIFKNIKKWIKKIEKMFNNLFLIRLV